jgi:hypothetical protein
VVLLKPFSSESSGTASGKDLLERNSARRRPARLESDSPVSFGRAETRAHAAIWLVAAKNLEHRRLCGIRRRLVAQQLQLDFHSSIGRVHEDVAYRQPDRETWILPYLIQRSSASASVWSRFEVEQEEVRARERPSIPHTPCRASVGPPTSCRKAACSPTAPSIRENPRNNFSGLRSNAILPTVNSGWSRCDETLVTSSVLIRHCAASAREPATKTSSRRSRQV